MKGETQKLVELLNDAGGVHEDAEPVVNVRGLWNWQRTGDDCDVEIGVGSYADVAAMLQVIRDHPLWTVRFMNSGDPNEIHLNIALIFHPPENRPDGTLFTGDA